MEQAHFLLPHAYKETWALQLVHLHTLRNAKHADEAYAALTLLISAKPSKGQQPYNFSTIFAGVANIHTVLAFIADTAIKVETLPIHIPFLRTNCPGVVRLTRSEVAILIACCFCCLLTPPEYKMLDMNFTGFYDARASEKLKFYLAYFCSVMNGESDITSTITVARVTHPNYSQLNTEYWQNSKHVLNDVYHHPSGKLEDIDEAMHVDFADAYIGGGVDGTGDQEQIMFVIYPEVHVSYIVCERMSEKEAIIISGYERYGKYLGYGYCLKLDGAYLDPLKGKRDSENRIPRQLIGIDALPHMGFTQLEEKFLLRELNKALIGFTGDGITKGEMREISTGKWGCGAFGGSTQLKFLIQWMAASECGRRMHFFSFGDSSLLSLKQVMGEWVGKTVGDLYSRLCELGKQKANPHQVFMGIMK